MKYAYLLIFALLFSPIFAHEAAAQVGSQVGWWDSILEERDGEPQRRGGVERGDRDDERRRFPRRERSRQDDDRDDDDGRWDDDSEWDDDEWEDDDRRRGDRRRGPKFCRTGEGHPVFGMEWCRGKGWSRGDDRRRDRNDRWERNRDWGEIIFRDGDDRRRDRDRNRRGTLEENVLEDILGGAFLNRLEAYSRALNLGSDVEGRWVEGDGRTRILQLRANGRPLAELADYDGDGRVDAAIVASR